MSNRQPFFAVLFAAVVCRAAPGAELPDLAQAKPGAVIELPAGTFGGGVTVPPGVTLRGAGYQQTVIEARGAAVAIAVKGQGARVENLSVKSSGVGIDLAGTEDIAVRRVMILGGTTGIRAAQVERATIENVIVSRALIGISLNRTSRSTVANCTVFTADACGLSVSHATDAALFNNLVVNAGTGVVVGGENRNLALDYNLYVALSIGKIEGQLQRPSLPTWRDVTGGLDAHSVQMNVTFANPSRNDFHPVSTLTWNPARIVTADWGVPELGGHKAPATDLDGQPRAGAYDLGAFEAPDMPSRPADGQFSIVADEGLKSAGLFTPDNRAVYYLFHGLPLKKGGHGFTLPARDLFGQTIPPGNYELRVVESPVDWTYRGMVANAGIGTTTAESDSVHIGLVAYTPDNLLLTASGWSERHINLRLGDPATGKARWVFEGSADSTGLCLDGEGRIYLARNGADKNVDLYRIDAATGNPIARPDGRLCVNLKGKFKSQYLGGIAELGGKLYAADLDVDKLLFDGVDSLNFSSAVDVPKPRSPAADRKRNLIWLVSNREKVLALDAAGRRVHELGGVNAPLALTVAGDTLAVASAETGKIHFFDIANPGTPKATKAFGRGDGPFGKWLPDRFHFQSHPRNPNNGPVNLALAANGLLTVRDSSGRVVTFAADGQSVHDGFAVWGGDPYFAAFSGDPRPRAFDSNACASYFIEAKTGKWEPDAYWGLPPMTQPNVRGFFSVHGKNFGVFTCQAPDKKAGEWIVIASYDNPVVRAVAVYKRNPVGGSLLAKDTNNDGLIDDTDEPGTPVLDTAGKPVTNALSGRFMFVDPDGTIYHSGHQLALIWRIKGLDARGVPVYEFPKDMVLAPKDPVVPSPYFADKTDDLRCASTAKFVPHDGGICAGINLRHTLQGMGLSNSGATDLARWSSDGTLRWLRTTNDYSPIQGVAVFPDVIVSSWGHQCEYMALDGDGLELGRFGFPAAANWNGFWVDHPQEWSAVRSENGDVQLIIGDYVTNSHHWMTVRHVGGVRKSRVPMAVSPAKARELAYRVPVLHQPLGKAPPPEIVIKKLPGPMAIDGNPAKWRGFPPQILLLPQNSFGKIDGPADCSGVIRLGYHGRDLYGAAVVFDDKVSFHQPANRFYQADSLQFCINGFLPGFGFNLARTIDKGPLFMRNRFYFQKMDLDLDPAKAPRIIKTFDNAKDLPERQYIEGIYGVDLSASPGYVIEFKLPLDESTYQGDEKTIPSAESGKWFWLGFMLNDNDAPGTDVQNFISWPATFGMFNPPEAGAKAIYE